MCVYTCLILHLTVQNAANKVNSRQKSEILTLKPPQNNTCQKNFHWRPLLKPTFNFCESPKTSRILYFFSQFRNALLYNGEKSTQEHGYILTFRVKMRTLNKIKNLLFKHITTQSINDLKIEPVKATKQNGDER